MADQTTVANELHGLATGIEKTGLLFIVDITSENDTEAMYDLTPDAAEWLGLKLLELARVARGDVPLSQ